MKRQFKLTSLSFLLPVGSGKGYILEIDIIYSLNKM